VPATVATSLYHEFYDRQKAGESGEASSHWKAFSKNFEVVFDESGQIVKLKGYGFGGSDDSRLQARLTASIGNELQLQVLRWPGLRTEMRQARELVRRMGLFFSQDAFRQACTRSFLREHIAQLRVENILIIGDGHGILAALLHQEYPQANIFLIDLGATLFFQAWYLQRAFPDAVHLMANEIEDVRETAGFYYCPAEHLQDLRHVNFDLAINVASMQEMNMDTVRNYFTLLRRHSTHLFYCCNRLEKQLPDGTVTRFTEYPWKTDDKILVDEACPWHQFFAGRSAAANLRIFGWIPVPLLHRYDGIHWHRLVKLAK